MADISQIKLPDNTVYNIKDAGALRTITSSNVTTALGYTPLNSTLKGANNGVAELDANGKVPSSQLPSYVDDVLEYAELSSFPTTGETGKIYIAQDTNKTYRWSGTAYTEISSSLALGTTSSTAYRGDYGNAAYTHAVTNKGAAFTSGLYKITTNGEGHVTNAVAVQKSDITALGIPAENTNDAVTQTPATTNESYELLFSATADNLSHTEGVKKTSTLTYNPSTKALSTGGEINGYTLNAASAKAVDTSLSTGSISTSTNLPTSNAVANAIVFDRGIHKAFTNSSSSSEYDYLTINVLDTELLYPGRVFYVLSPAAIPGNNFLTLTVFSANDPGIDMEYDIYINNTTKVKQAFPAGTLFELLYYNSKIYLINAPHAI